MGTSKSHPRKGIIKQYLDENLLSYLFRRPGFPPVLRTAATRRQSPKHRHDPSQSLRPSAVCPLRSGGTSSGTERQGGLEPATKLTATTVKAMTDPGMHGDDACMAKIGNQIVVGVDVAWIERLVHGAVRLRDPSLSDSLRPQPSPPPPGLHRGPRCGSRAGSLSVGQLSRC